MNATTSFTSRLLKHRRQLVVAGTAMLMGVPLGIQGGGVVTNCTEAALRAAMAGGGTITFACDGTITLASSITNLSDTTLDGGGRQVNLSGNAAVRVFCVNTNVHLTLVNLMISGGRSLGGSAILNLGGNVNLTGVTFRSNTATMEVANDALSPRGSGGAIFNRGGTVNATNCSFVSNVVQIPIASAESPGSITNLLLYGGALRNEAGQMNLRACAFVSNQAFAGPGYHSVPGDRCRGGAIHNSGTLTMDLCTSTGNSAAGGNGGGPWHLYAGGAGGEGSGGAVFNDGSLTIDRTTFCANTAKGGTGGGGGTGDPYATFNGFPGGNGGGAYGGAICSYGTSWIARSTFASNAVTAGAGGSGGSGYQHIDMGGNGARAGDGGSGIGGAVFGGGSLANCTIAFNIGRAGNGGMGGMGTGHVTGSMGTGGAGGNGGSGDGGVSGGTLLNCTVARNLGQAGAGGQGGSGTGGNGASGSNGNAYVGTGAGSTNTLVASNTPSGGDSFPDPKLGPLADNGGPTLTMALLPSSPAIDAGGTAAAPPTDQRGVPRPFGLKADIGAVEFWPTLQVSRSGADGLDILASGISGQTCRLLRSSNASSWVAIATNQFGIGGTVLLYDTCAPGNACRFYRLVMP